MDMTVKNVDLEVVNDFFSKTTQEVGISKGMSYENSKRFFEMRIKYLDKYLDQLEEEEKQLEEKLKDDIEKLIAEKGAEILSIQQIIRLTAKECGACEAHLDSLKEKFETGDKESA